MLRTVFFSPQLPYGRELWALCWSFVATVGVLAFGFLVEYALSLSNVVFPGTAVLAGTIGAVVWFGNVRGYDVMSVYGIVAGVLTVFIGTGYLTPEWNFENLAALILGFLITMRFWSVGPDNRTR